LTINNLNIHVIDFNLIKITFLKEKISLTHGFYFFLKKLFEIASFLESFLKIFYDSKLLFLIK
jgi:hypothetical protein